MSKNLEVVKRFGKAFFDKDIDTIKEIVAENYWFKGPVMEMKSSEEFIGYIQNMPMQAKEVKADYIEQGNQVVKVCTFGFSAPHIGPQELCEVFTIENGKIVGHKLFYDTAKFPKPEEACEKAV